MKKLIVLLLLFGCVEEKIVIYKNCFDMTIPQGNPVKFWLNGVESFNEKVVPGIMQVCFFQKFNNDDELNIQIYDAGGSTFELVVRDKDGEFLGHHAFTETADYYNLSLTLTPYGDQKIQLFIIDSADNVYYIAPSSWTSDVSYDPFTSYTSTSLIKNAAGISTYAAHQPAVLSAGITPLDGRFTIGYTQGSGGTSYLRFEFIDDLDVVVSTSEVFEFTANFNGELTIQFPELTGPSTKFRIVYESGSSASNITIFVNVGNPVYLNDESAKSDLLDIADNDETYLIQYSNELDFAGLDYSAGTIFGVRVESSFFKERFPEEDESEEISDGSVVKLSGSVKNQRLLQIEPTPFYFHNLLKRVLQHNTIYIDGLYWEKEEAYEISEIGPRQPLQKGEVWLTQKEDGYDTNVYGTLTNI